MPNCGRDYVAVTLPGECCERCVPWEYAQSTGLVNRGPQAIYGTYDTPNPSSSVSVYIYGPDEGARVSNGQSIYFDCEVIAPYNQNVQPRWSRAGNQVNTKYSIGKGFYFEISMFRCSHYHINHRAQFFLEIVNLPVLLFLMPPLLMLVDMNVVLARAIQEIKLPLTYKLELPFSISVSLSYYI